MAPSLPSYSLFALVALEEFPFFRAARKRKENRLNFLRLLGSQLQLTVFIIRAGLGDASGDDHRGRVTVRARSATPPAVADVFDCSVGQHHFCLFRLQREIPEESLRGSSAPGAVEDWDYSREPGTGSALALVSERAQPTPFDTQSAASVVNIREAKVCNTNSYGTVA